MQLKFTFSTFLAPQLVKCNPQFGFINSLVSQAVGFGESLASDFIPTTPGPQSSPSPSSSPPSAPATLTSLQPTSSPSPLQPTLSTSIVTQPRETISIVTSPSSILSSTLSLTRSSIHTSTSTTSRSSIASPSHISSKTVSQSAIIASVTSAPRVASPRISHSDVPAIVIGVVCAVLAVLAILALIWFFRRRKNQNSYATFEDQQTEASSIGSGYLHNDEKPLARYDGPLAANAEIGKPLPVLMAQRKYLPYRPPRQRSNAFPNGSDNGNNSKAQNSAHVSEIDGRPVTFAPIELEGSTPVLKVINKSSVSSCSEHEFQAPKSIGDSSTSPIDTKRTETARPPAILVEAKNIEKVFEIAKKPMAGVNHD